MAMSSASKSPGRTPPFVLVALVLIVVILGYNYWVMSSSNRSLRDMNDKLAVETKDTAEKRLSAEKNLESAREELRVLQGNLVQVKKSLEDKDAELNNVRADQNRANEENNKCKETMATCDQNLQAEKKNVENITAEKVKLETDLANSNGKACTPDACIQHVKDVLVISSKLVGTDKMSQALAEAKLDATKLMEGIEKFEAPQVQTASAVKVTDSPATSNNSKMHAASKNASENLTFKSDKMVGEQKVGELSQSNEMNKEKKEDLQKLDVKEDKQIMSEPETGVKSAVILTTEANNADKKPKEPVVE